MTHKRLWIAAAIIALVLVIVFALSVPRTSGVPEKMSAPPEELDTPVVKLRDAFKKGTHTITGSLETPNACAIVNAIATLVDANLNTQNIRVDISSQNDAGVCLQLPATANFSVTIPAPARLPITATVNGIEAKVDML